MSLGLPMAGKRYLSDCTVQTVKFGGGGRGMMLCGCFSGTGRGPLSSSDEKS